MVVETPILLAIAACFVIGIAVGKKNPVIGGAFFAVALMMILWAPGGLI